MKQNKLVVKTSTENYPIFIGSNLILNISKILKDNLVNFEKCLLVIDKNIPKKSINKIKKSLKSKKLFFYYINATEKNKNQKTSNAIIKILLIKNFSRNDCLIALGGGITGDVSGFAASLFKRGMKFINIPTTLLSQVDSSIGGKTGVNTNYGKNLVGNFYQPKIVIADINFLKSLKKREIICGYGEILKHSLIHDKNFYKFLDKNFLNIINLKSPYIEKAIYESCKIKKSVVEKDEKENGLRKILNFGHTIGHAIEAFYLSSNSYKTKTHGECIAIGIVLESFLSMKLRNFSKAKCDKIKNFILSIYDKVNFSEGDKLKIIDLMQFDKKNQNGIINFVLLDDIGSPKFDNKIDINLIVDSFNYYQA